MIGAAPEGDDVGAFVRRTALDAYTAADSVAEMIRAGGREDGGSGNDLSWAAVAHRPAHEVGRRARVYYTQHGGYDTHAGQLRPHASLLFELSEALRRFQDNLAASGLADRVLVLCFSEFGRRVHENASGGTDHGTAGPVFLVGKHVRAGLVGETPSLLDLEDGDLKMAVDFRRIYAAVLQDWLALPAARARRAVRPVSRNPDVAARSTAHFAIRSR